MRKCRLSRRLHCVAQTAGLTAGMAWLHFVDLHNSACIYRYNLREGTECRKNYVSRTIEWKETVCRPLMAGRRTHRSVALAPNMPSDSFFSGFFAFSLSRSPEGFLAGFCAVARVYVTYSCTTESFFREVFAMQCDYCRVPVESFTI